MKEVHSDQNRQLAYNTSTKVSLCWTPVSTSLFADHAHHKPYHHVHGSYGQQHSKRQVCNMNCNRLEAPLMSEVCALSVEPEVRESYAISMTGYL